MDGRAPLPVFVNPRAGKGGAAAYAELAAALERAGVAAEVRPVEPGRLAAEVAAAVRAGAAVVGVGGGDGSFSTAAGVLAGTGSALAVLPMGTLNHFPRRLGIQDMATAIGVLTGGVVADVPVGAADGRVFLNTLTCGEYARVVRRRDRLRRFVGKWPAAGLAFAHVVFRARSLEVELEAAGARLARTTPLVWVGLGRCTFPRTTAGEPAAAATELEVVTLRAAGGWQRTRLLGRIAALALRGAHPRADRRFEVLHTRALRLRATHGIDATVDGEPTRFASELTLTLRERGLRVLMPPA